MVLPRDISPEEKEMTQANRASHRLWAKIDAFCDYPCYLTGNLLTSQNAASSRMTLENAYGQITCIFFAQATCGRAAILQGAKRLAI
jgi:hypothetical protein